MAQVVQHESHVTSSDPTARFRRRDDVRRYRLYIGGALALIVLNVVDVVLTQRALAAGASEGNPLAAFLLERATLVLSVKFVLPLALLAMAWMRKDRARIDEYHLAAIYGVVGVYVMTVVVNAMSLAAL